MYVVTFADYTPNPRYDGEKWTSVNVDEGAAADGPWTRIESMPLIPLDADPSDPMSRSFTTDNATLENGWYRISFENLTGDILYTDPVYNAPTEAELPTVRQIAALLPTRTQSSDGTYQGTFNEKTIPTGEQVEVIIRLAALDVNAILSQNPNATTEVTGTTESMIAMRSAMLVELTFFPEQVTTNRSAYQHYKDLYDAWTSMVIPGGEGGSSGDGMTGIISTQSNSPEFSFPHKTPLVGLDTVM